MIRHLEDRMAPPTDNRAARKCSHQFAIVRAGGAYQCRDCGKTFSAKAEEKRGEPTRVGSK